MYKHILVAVDGSDTSNLALQEAIRLAKEQTALRLVHVVDETPVYMTMVTIDAPFSVADYQKAMREAGQKVLADLCRGGLPSRSRSRYKIRHS